MAKRTMKTSSDVGGGGTIISEPGTYHVQVLNSADGASTKGNPIDGCSALLSVLAGTVDNQTEKQFHLTLFDPDMSKDESKQEWSIKKQTAYGIAINEIDPSKLGEELEMDFDNADGQQFLISLDYGRKKITNDDGKEEWVEDKDSLQLKFANIYHIDDPRAKDFPKNKEAMGLLPKEMRRPAEYFSAIQKGAVASKGTAQPRMSDADLSDL